MKICPKCNKTYTDETLNFCLDDGAVLKQAGDPPKTDDSLPETVMMDPPRPTEPNQSFGTEAQSGFGNETPNTPFGNPSQAGQSWGGTQSSQMQSAKPKSRAWLWVLGILVGVVFLCGGGLALIVALSGFEETPDKDSKDNTKVTFSDNKKDKPSKADFTTINLSNCDQFDSSNASVVYKNDECIVETRKRGYYYVINMGSDYKTRDETTRVSVRNTDEKETRLGFGLVFHSNPTPLEKGYAFLIDSENQKYRVVKHVKKDEKEVIGWKKSKVIKTGSQKNVLEVRSDRGKIDLYINGQYIDTLKNTDGYDSGVPGIYSSDGIPVAFSNLETTG